MRRRLVGLQAGTNQRRARRGQTISNPDQKTLKSLLIGASDLMFSLDSRLWRTLIGLVRHPVRTNQAYLTESTDLLNPLKLLVGLCSVSVVLWALLPATPAFMDTLQDVAPEAAEQLRRQIEPSGVAWAHFVDAVNQRANLLNAPFVLLISLPVMLYFKLIKRDRPALDHAVLTLNAFNVFALFHILSAPLYFLPIDLMVLGGLPLLLVLVPYLLLLVARFYARGRLHGIVIGAGLLLVLAVGYFIASNAVVLGAIHWAKVSVGAA